MWSLIEFFIIGSPPKFTELLSHKDPSLWHLLQDLFRLGYKCKNKDKRRKAAMVCLDWHQQLLNIEADYCSEMISKTVNC